MLGQRVSLQGFAVSPGSKEVSPLSAQKMECMSTVTNCPQRIVRPEKNLEAFKQCWWTIFGKL